MNFFEYEQQMYDPDAAFAMDDAVGEAATQAAREATPEAQHGEEKSAKQIAEFSDKGKILSAEELLEHRKHCRAKPGNCPFEKAVDEADNITPNEINITKQTVYDRLASVLTQMFQVAKNLAKPAIADAEAVEEEVSLSVDEKISQDKWSIYAPVVDKAPTASIAQDAAPENPDTNPDAKIVAEIIEGGIEKMVELAKGKGCKVDMDDSNTKYIVKGPENTASVE